VTEDGRGFGLRRTLRVERRPGRVCRKAEGVDTCRDPFMHAAELATPTSLSHKRVALAQSLANVILFFYKKNGLCGFVAQAIFFIIRNTILKF
jgi:hypothetical protein